MKFMQVDNHIQHNILAANPLVGGYYNWHRVFGGEFCLLNDVRDKLQDYDVVFLALTKFSLESRLIRDITTNGKIVVTIDYAIELWKDVINPAYLEEALQFADMVITPTFTCEMYLRSIFDHDKIVRMAHPSDLDAIATYAKPAIDKRQRDAVSFIHNYESNWLAPYLVMREQDCRGIAVTNSADVQAKATPFFQYIMEAKPYPEYLSWVSSKYAYVESYHSVHSYGRTQVENAVLGLPTIGADNITAQRQLWPSLTSEVGDVHRQRQLLRRLLDDRQFYQDACEYAADAVAVYGYESKKREFTNKLSEVSNNA